MGALSRHRVLEIQQTLLAALVFPVGIVVTSGALMAGVATAQDAATPTPTAPGVLGTPAADTGCNPEFGATPETGVAVNFQIVSEESIARYRAQEELVGRGAAEAVGETNAFIGNIFLDDQGRPIPCSRFRIVAHVVTVGSRA